MHNKDTELLFPPRLIPSLRNLRGETWQALIDKIIEEEIPEELLAFVLMMVRLNGCATCNADSYRAMHGCTQCAKQTIRRHRGNDEELIALFTSAVADVEEYNNNLNGK